jgi:hypothetical protein
MKTFKAITKNEDVGVFLRGYVSVFVQKRINRIRAITRYSKVHAIVSSLKNKF